MNDSEAQLKQTELDLARHESNCGHIREQLQQDYQLDEAAARGQDFAELQAMDLAALQKQESCLTLQIADLGPINAAAIEEYNAVKERSEFLCKQYNDFVYSKGKSGGCYRRNQQRYDQTLQGGLCQNQRILCAMLCQDIWRRYGGAASHRAG